MANLFCSVCTVESAIWFAFKGEQKVKYCERDAESERRSGTLLFPVGDINLMDSERDTAFPSHRRSEAESARSVLASWRRNIENARQTQQQLLESRRKQYLAAVSRICDAISGTIDERYAAIMRRLDEVEADLGSFSVNKGYQLPGTGKLLMEGEAPVLQPLVWSTDLPLIFHTLLPSALGLANMESSNSVDVRKLRMNEIVQRIDPLLSSSHFTTALESIELLCLSYSFFALHEDMGSEYFHRLHITTQSVLRCLVPFTRQKNIRNTMELAGPEVVKKVKTLWEIGIFLGKSLHNAKDYSSSIDLLKLLHQWESVYRPNTSELADVAFALGQSLKLKKEKRAAIPLLEEVVRIRSTVGSHILDQANAFVLLGRCIKSSGDAVKALNLYKEGKRRYKESGNAPVQLAKVYYYISPLRNEFRKREKSCKKAIEIQQRIAPVSIHLADSYNRLGHLYSSVNQNAEAERVILQAIAIYEKLPESTIDLSRSQIALGNIYLTQGTYQKAIDTLTIALTTQFKSQDLKDTAICYECLGLSYYKLGNPSSAYHYFQQSKSTYEQSQDFTSSAIVAKFIADNNLRP